MSESNTFTFPLDQFTETGKSLLLAAQQNPAAFGLSSVVIAVAGLTIVGGLVTIIVPIAVGFGAAGPVAGTLAAAWQASIGNVVAGSLFAMLQSLTMSGTLVTVGGVLVAVGAVGLAGAVHWAKSVDWSGNAGEMVEQWANAMQLVGREGWRRTEGVRNVDWQGVAESVEWMGKEIWKKTEEGVRSGEWEGMTERAGREAWKRTEKGFRNVVPEKVVQRAEWLGKEAWKRTEEGVGSVDWEGVAEGAERARKETWKKAEEGVRGVDWEGMGQGIQRALNWW